MLNYRCMEKLAMSGDTEESENVRTYFTKLREFIYDNQELINQSLDKFNTYNFNNNPISYDIIDI